MGFLLRRKAEPAGTRITLLDHDDYDGRIARLSEEYIHQLKSLLAERDAAWGDVIHTPEQVHGYFDLSYASYLVWARVCMQSMPEHWQIRFVQVAQEFQDAFRHLEEPHYLVSAQADSGKFIKDPMPRYNRGRTRIPLDGDPDLGAWLAQHPEVDRVRQNLQRWADS